MGMTEIWRLGGKHECKFFVAVVGVFSASEGSGTSGRRRDLAIWPCPTR
jgi:hypothetical protein